MTVITENHFAAPGKRVEASYDPGLTGTVVEWNGPSGEILVQWDGLDFPVVTYAFDLEPA